MVCTNDIRHAYVRPETETHAAVLPSLLAGTVVGSLSGFDSGGSEGDWGSSDLGGFGDGGSLGGDLGSSTGGGW